MLKTAQNPVKEVKRSKKDKFLIVPIFFRQRIETLLESGASPTNFGFYYGEEQENFSIIKKIWSVKDLKINGRLDLSNCLSLAQQIAKESSLKLLGFFSSSNNMPNNLGLALNGAEGLSNIQLIIENGVTQDWMTNPDVAFTQNSVQQRIIL